jgi:threonylcarbamoyladenosine tRNA methylthiotransferase MtaB
MKILIKTLGCKSNRADSDRLADKLGDEFGSGIEVAEINNASDLISDSGPGAISVDVCVVNTCTVTHVADRKSRAQIKLFKKNYPEALLVVMGCGPRVDSEAFEEMGVNFIGAGVEDVVGYLKGLDNLRATEVDGDVASRETAGVRTRSVVKIQDGCNNFCTYCIIPFARGREKSFPSAEVLREVHAKVKAGYKEVVLTGINIGNWEEDGSGLADLIVRILEETDVKRLRLSSIEPQNFGEGFEKLLSDPQYAGSGSQHARFCPHLHMSLQSGSDRVLKLMRRRYGTELYKKVAQRMRELSPDIALTTDVIVGFPGESDADFEETCEFVRKVGFSKVHVFPYSKRRGTKAAVMDGQIQEQVKKKRARELQAIANKLRDEFWEGQVGKVSTVLIEQRVARSEDEIWEGFTPNYIKVRIRSERDLTNEIVEVRLYRIADTDKTKAAYMEATLV